MDILVCTSMAACVCRTVDVWLDKRQDAWGSVCEFADVVACFCESRVRL